MPLDVRAVSLTEMQAALAGAQPAPRNGVVAAVRDAFLGWFGPGLPVPSQAPADTPPRQFDYPLAVNYQLRPRAEELIDFETLRRLSRACTILRAGIETRKSQLDRFTWSIAERSEEQGGKPQRRTRGVKTVPPRVQAITDFLRRPNRRETFKQWLRMLVEEVFVTDAPTVYAQRNRGGDVYSLDLIDGATIRPLLDQTGRTPCEPGLPAYRQIVKGLPATDFAMPGCGSGGLPELIYAPRNRTVDRIYGFSPTEQLFLTVNIAIRRELAQLEWFTDGTVPEAIVSVPNEWTPAQVREFDVYWQQLMGTTADRRRMRFIPQAEVKELKAAPLKDEFDEWLARVVSWTLDLPPTWAVKMMNRASSDRAQETATDEGLIPLMLWVKDLMELVLATAFQAPDLEFNWQDVRDADPKVKADIDDLAIRNGSKSVDEVREENGLEKIGMSHAVYTSQGPVLIKNIIEEGNLSLEQRQALKRPPMPEEPPPDGGGDGEDGGDKRSDGDGGSGEGGPSNTRGGDRRAAGGAETEKERTRPSSSLRKITLDELSVKKKGSARGGARTGRSPGRPSGSSLTSWSAL